VKLPNAVDGWKQIPAEDEYRPRLNEGDTMGESVYQNTATASQIYLMINFFHRQRQGVEAVSDSNRFADGREWSRSGGGRVDSNLPGFGDIGEVRLRARNGEKKLVWYWYETNGVKTSSGWQAKLQNIIAILKGQPDIRMVVVAIDPKSGVVEARNQLRDFIQKINSQIQIVSLSI
jgi:EpsI family protein